MPNSETLASWLMLACLSMFIAVSIVAGCTLSLYMAEARHYQKLTGEPSTVFDEIWEDFRPKQPIVKRRSSAAAAPSPPPR